MIYRPTPGSLAERLYCALRDADDWMTGAELGELIGGRASSVGQIMRTPIEHGQVERVIRGPLALYRIVREDRDPSDFLADVPGDPMAWMAGQLCGKPMRMGRGATHLMRAAENRQHVLELCRVRYPDPVDWPMLVEKLGISQSQARARLAELVTAGRVERLHNLRTHGRPDLYRAVMA